VDNDLRVMNTPSLFVLRKRADIMSQVTTTALEPNLSIQGIAQDFKNLPDDLNSVDVNVYFDALKRRDPEALFGTFSLLVSLLAVPSLMHGGTPGSDIEKFSHIFLAIFVAVSAGTKFTTGVGLAAGPGGILGGAEGIAYLLFLGIILQSLVSHVFP